jgi:hypothetical protein
MRRTLAVLGLLVAGSVLAAPVPERLKPGQASKGGLSLTVTLNKQTFRPADEIVLSFVLKNESKQVLFVGDGYLGLAYHETGPGRHFEGHVRAAERTPLLFWSGILTEGRTCGIRRVFQLKPGQSYTGSLRLSAGRENDANPANRKQEDRGGSFEDQNARQAHVLGRDARRYTVSLRYQVRPDSHGVWQPPADFKKELLWQGELTSSPIPFEVLDK